MPGEKLDLLTPEQAVNYLAKRWGLPSYSIEAFRQYRRRRGIRSEFDTGLANATLWPRSQLDTLEPPNQSKAHHRPRRAEKNREPESDEEQQGLCLAGTR